MLERMDERLRGCEYLAGDGEFSAADIMSVCDYLLHLLHDSPFHFKNSRLSPISLLLVACASASVLLTFQGLLINDNALFLPA